MNKPIDFKFADFKASLDTTIACPYCGEPNQLDPALLCCGEVHAQLFYVIDEDLVDESRLKYHFDTWLRLQDKKTAGRADRALDSFRDSED